MTAPVTPLIGDLGTPELLIILAVVILLFGSSKLPELARGSGRALRIFKAETKGLMDEDDDAKPSAASATTPATTTPPVVSAPTAVPPVAAAPTAPITNAAELEARRRELVALQAELDAEAARLRGQSPTA